MIGAGSFIAIKWIVELGHLTPFNLSFEKKAVANTISGFTFTSLGVLAASASILLAFTERRAFKRYKEKGNLRIFMSLYIATVLSLVANAFLSIANLSPQPPTLSFQFLIALFFINVLQLFFIFFILFNIALKAMKD